jgi:hypothetical protein
MQTIALTFCMALSFAVLAHHGRADVVLPCAGDAAPEAALALADQHVKARWRFDGPNIHTAFDAKPPVANPFDLAAAKAAAEGKLDDTPIRGHVWGQGFACRVEARGPSGPFIVRYFTSVAAFHEGQGWSAPLPGGALQVLVLVRQGEGYRLIDRSADETMLLPGAVLRRPEASELPKADRAGGVPCAPTRLWNGRLCASPDEVRGRTTSAIPRRS